MIGGEVDKLVHKSLPESFQLTGSRISVSHLCKIRIHAGIPAAESLNAMACIIISYVVALACGADEGASATAQAGL